MRQIKQTTRTDQLSKYLKNFIKKFRLWSEKRFLKSTFLLFC